MYTFGQNLKCLTSREARFIFFWDGGSIYLKSTGHSAFSFFSISGNTDKFLGKGPTQKKVNERNLKRKQYAGIEASNTMLMDFFLKE